MKTVQFMVFVCCLLGTCLLRDSPVVYAQESELIMQFAPGTSPYDLQKQVTERKDREKSTFGKVKVTLEDLTLQFLNKLTPEEKLARLTQVDEQAGMIMRERLLSDLSIEGIYLVRLNGNWSVEQAEILYSSIPEIVFAEENVFAAETL